CRTLGGTCGGVHAVPTRRSSDLAAEVRRLAREIEVIRGELSRRPMGSDSGGSRRDLDKVVADRLARLDEKVDSVWNRLADLEERSEEHTSELQSPYDLVCRLLLE